MSGIRKTLLPWFKKFMKPTEDQFAYWIKGCWFKDEKIPVSNISGLDELLQSIELKMLNKGGLSHVAPIQVGTTSVDFNIPDNGMLYGFESSGKASIIIVNGADEITWDTAETPIIELGLSKTKKVSIIADVDVLVSPIIYFKAKALI